jgi:hypothetical protein
MAASLNESKAWSDASTRVRVRQVTYPAISGSESVLDFLVFRQATLRHGALVLYFNKILAETLQNRKKAFTSLKKLLIKIRCNRGWKNSSSTAKHNCAFETEARDFNFRFVCFRALDKTEAFQPVDPSAFRARFRFLSSFGRRQATNIIGEYTDFRISLRILASLLVSYGLCLDKIIPIYFSATKIAIYNIGLKRKKGIF